MRARCRWHRRTATVGYLDQEPERADETVLGYVERRTGVVAAHLELDAATAAMAGASPGADDRYSTALDRWLALGAADLDMRVGEMWAELSLPDRLLQQPMASLSGGEAARVSLAALMLTRFDVLLLDEPTNNLDLDSLDRLERFVNGVQGAVALVSHDREFLRRVVTDVAELDEFTHGLTVFAGGYDTYIHERELARQHAWEAWEVYDSKRSTLAQRSQREREWATQGLSRAKKRPDDNDKNIKAFKINQTEQLAGRAARTERAMERLDVVEQPRESWDLRMTIASAPRSGALVASLSKAVVEVGSFRLGPVTLAIRVRRASGDRRAERQRQVDAARRIAGRDPVDRRHATVGTVGEVGTVGAGAHATRFRWRSVHAGRVPSSDRFDDQRGTDVAGQVRHRRRTRAPTRRVAVAGRAHTTGAGVVHGRWLQLPGARRADQPPRSTGHRADRAGGGHVSGDGAAGHARSRAARTNPPHPHHRAPLRAGRVGHRRVDVGNQPARS